MKTLSLIILVLFLLQPLASFANPCDLCLNNQITADNSGNTGGVPIHQDSNSTDCTDCYDENIYLKTGVTVKYVPLSSSILPPTLNNKLLKIVMPIFLPPQNLV
jgi:hypothetical protein